MADILERIAKNLHEKTPAEQAQTLAALAFLGRRRATNPVGIITSVEASAAKASLHTFVKTFWRMVEPEKEFVDNWHIRELCKVLEAVTRGEIKRLIVNIPPASSKSLIVSVFWPAWQWSSNPRLRFLTASYGTHLTIRDNLRVRDICKSDSYRTHYPLRFTGDQNVKELFNTTQRGWRFATSVGGAGTGEHPDIIIIDDPVTAAQARSSAERETVRLWFKRTISSRGVARGVRVVVIMQRLHEEDLSGYLLNLGGWEHVCWPMRFDPKRRDKRDPRTEPNELLWPALFPEDVVRQLEIDLDEYGTASQMQQRPAPEGGGLFKRTWFEFVDEVPVGGVVCRGWDMAGSEGSGDWTAGVKIRQDGGLYYVEDVRRGQWGPHTAEKEMVLTAQFDGKGTRQREELEPGAAGKPLGVDTRILMADGSYVRLGDIKEGDSVIGGSGQPRDVLAVHDQGCIDTLRMILHSGREIVSGLEHPFLTPDGWVRADALREGDVLGLISRPSTAGATDRSDEEFRLTGYFIGDGSCGWTGLGPRASPLSMMACFDPVELSDIRHCCEALGFTMRENARGLPGNYYIGKCKQWLRDTQLAGKVSYTKRVPAWVFTAPNEKVAQFLGAYFACDGHLDLPRRTAEFYSVSVELLRDVQHLLLRFGVVSRLSVKNGQYDGKRHASWRLYLANGDDASWRFVSRIPIYHSTKAKLLSEVGRRRTRFDEPLLPERVAAIKPAGTRPCRCLTIDVDQTFCAEDVVVHNSIIAARARLLAGYDYGPSSTTGDKVTRVRPFRAQCEAGNVRLKRGPWNEAYLAELEVFPSGAHDDQVDASAAAFNELTGGPRPIRTRSLAWG